MNFWFILILAVILVVFCCAIFFVWKSRTRLSKKDIEYLKSHWIRITSEVKSNSAQTILDVDKLLDYALGKKGLSGSLGDKLKKGGHLFSDINGVWNAHKLRNKMAHELSQVSDKEVYSALNSYKKALKDLGVPL